MAPFFPIIGAAVIPADIQGQPAVLLSKHFNSITSGNDMKWDATEPTEGNFTFTQADAEVAFAQANNMHVRGHTLVWYNQTPAWVFTNASGQPMTGTPDEQALLIQRMQRHIQTVMTHFGNAVPIWDVVNEPIDESQPDGYRRSPWFNILGPQYIPIALQAARAANPTAKLYINEFNTTIPAKRDFLVALVRSLKSQGVPLDGIGHQMHNNIQFPSGQSIIDAVNLFDTTGVEQAVTEMDVSIYNGTLTDAVHRLHRHPAERPHPGRLRLSRVRPGLQAGGEQDRVDHHLGDLGRQVVAPRRPPRSTRRCCSMSRCSTSTATGRSSIRCRSRARISRPP